MGIDVTGPIHQRRRDLLTLRSHQTFDFLPGTPKARTGDWKVAAAPADPADLRVEITGPSLRVALDGTLSYTSPERKRSALTDFGLYFFHRAPRPLASGSGPYFERMP